MLFRRKRAGRGGAAVNFRETCALFYRNEEAIMSSSNGEERASGCVPDQQVGNYRLERTIGQGTYGKVKIATHIHTDEKVCGVAIHAN